jgi:hypothetical protein
MGFERENAWAEELLKDTVESLGCASAFDATFGEGLALERVEPHRGCKQMTLVTSTRV